MILRAALFAILASSAASAQGLELKLAIPVDCEIGSACYISSYPDRDTGPGATDYACNPMSYDGHRGVDFNARTFAEMQAGIDVLAAAAGTVKSVRDGEPDTGLNGMTENRDCGNTLMIDHGDGWATRYCHMAKGSLSVKAGDIVATGDRLGLMGFSGRTQLPHLHMTVRKDGVPVDPFDARLTTENCALPDIVSLWSDEAKAQIAYKPGGVVNAGFADAVPTLADVRLGGMYDTPNAAAPILAFWARFYSVRKGDVIRIRLQRPGGKVFAQKDVPLTRTQTDYFHFVGGRKPANGWPKGTYRGGAALVRDGKIIDSITTQTIVK